jgi:hypothetical protein
MLEQTRKANEANAPHRQRIIEAKRKLRAQIHDMPSRFAAMTARVEAQIAQIVRERASGITPVPQIEFDQLDRVTDAQRDHIRQRGCLVIRNVFDDARVDAWTADLSEYLEANDYLDKLKKGGAVDDYFSTLASARPQIYGVFWSRAQMEARTDPAMARAHAFLNALWRAASPGGPVFDPDQSLVYADRGFHRSLDRSGVPRHGISPRLRRRPRSIRSIRSLGSYRNPGNSITRGVPHVPDVSRLDGIDPARPQRWNSAIVAHC